MDLRETGHVSRSITFRPDEHTVYTRTVSDTVDDSDRDGSFLGWSGYDVWTPGGGQHKKAICEANSEDHRDVYYIVSLMQA